MPSPLSHPLRQLLHLLTPISPSAHRPRTAHVAHPSISTFPTPPLPCRLSSPPLSSPRNAPLHACGCSGPPLVSRVVWAGLGHVRLASLPRDACVKPKGGGEGREGEQGMSTEAEEDEEAMRREFRGRESAGRRRAAEECSESVEPQRFFNS